MRTLIVPGVIVASALGFVIAAVCFVCAAAAESSDPRLFDVGDLVTLRLNGQRGQVVGVRSYGFGGRNGWGYRVMFAVRVDTTRVSLLGSDGPISSSPIGYVWCRAYAIESAETPERID